MFAIFSLFQSTSGSSPWVLCVGGYTGVCAFLSMICQNASNMGTLMQRSEVTLTHTSRPRIPPQPPVSVF